MSDDEVNSVASNVNTNATKSNPQLLIQSITYDTPKSSANASPNIDSPLLIASSITNLTPQSSCLSLSEFTSHINITLYDIPSSCIMSVYGFIHDTINKKTYSKIDQTIIHLISFMYAKPIA
eukprot:520323_1